MLNYIKCCTSDFTTSGVVEFENDDFQTDVSSYKG